MSSGYVSFRGYVVGGGSTLFQGFQERLKSDMTKMLQKRASVFQFKFGVGLHGAQIYARSDSKKSLVYLFSSLLVDRLVGMYEEGGAGV